MNREDWFIISVMIIGISLIITFASLSYLDPPPTFEITGVVTDIRVQRGFIGKYYDFIIFNETTVLKFYNEPSKYFEMRNPVKFDKVETIQIGDTIKVQYKRVINENFNQNR